MEFYLILENTKAMVFNWEGGDLRLNEKGEKNTVHKWLAKKFYLSANRALLSIGQFTLLNSFIFFNIYAILFNITSPADVKLKQIKIPSFPLI